MRIFVDFEATEAGEIIAVGAVTESDKRYFSVCKPLFTPLTERITALTGITEDTLKDAAPFSAVCADLVNWAIGHNTGSGVHFFSFGKNDRGFVNKTLDLYQSHGYDELTTRHMTFLSNFLSNGAHPIYQAFRRPLVGLRSAYLTYKNDTGDLHQSHNPLDDALMFKELLEAAEDGWTLPEDAEIVKVSKPTLPKKAPKEDFNTPDELHRTVVVYWRKGNQDRSAVYRDLIGAAKGTCTKALNAGVSPEQAAYRVLNAAINGESYCDRKFFLVD